MTDFAKNSLRLIIPAVIAAASVYLVYLVSAQVGGWTEPTVAPPGGNVAAALNTGSTGQSKSGGLILNTSGATNGLIVQSGKIGIGTTSPSHTFSVAGDINLTGGLYSSGNKSALFGGIYYTAGSSPGGSCLSSNPATGACSCPAGFTRNSYYVYQAGGIDCGWTAGYTATVPCYGQYVSINQCWK